MKPQPYNVIGVNVSSPAGKARQTGFCPGLPRVAVVLASFLLLCSAQYLFAYWFVLPKSLKDNREPSWKKYSLLSVKGFETTIFSRNRKTRIKIEALKIVPRKYFVFSIQPFNEVLLENVSIDSFREPIDQSMFQSPDAQEPLLPVDHKEFKLPFDIKAGVITRGVIRSFTLTLYEGDEQHSVINSENAELDFKDGNVRLENVGIEQHNFKRIIRADVAILKNANSTIYIPGDYQILCLDGVVRGKGMKITL